MTTRPSIIAEFKAGDHVPEWLLSVEPKRPDSVKPTITFICDSVILDFAGRYQIVPSEYSDDGVVSVRDGAEVAIIATTRTVLIPFKANCLTGREETVP